MKICRSLELDSSRGAYRRTVSQQNNLTACRRATNPGKYIILRRVAKSAAVSEDVIRGQPFGDSCVARLA